MNIVVILMSGKGTRVGEDTPKQYLLIDKKPLFSFCVDTFMSSKEIDKILLVSDEEHLTYVKEYVADYKKVMDVILGGETRIKSTQNALDYLKNNNVSDKDIILIHDAARPLVSASLIETLIKECKVHHSVVPSLKVSDTLVMSNDENVTEFVDRNKYYLNQTPQVFDFDIIYHAHKALKKEKGFSDDASIVKAFGKDVFIVNGEKSNFKITTKEDIDLLLYYLNK